MIQLKKITKIYGRGETTVHALDGIDLSIKKGDMVAIVGPSGSGKSTLLNIIGCLDKPTTGEYYLGDECVESYDSNQLAQLRNRVLGFVVQDFALIDKYTVFRNVTIPLMYANVKKKEQQQRADTIFRQIGIENKAKVLAKNLSGGQRQRVAICRALINNPDIILADEPTGALDQKTGHDVVKLLQEINASGKTVIIVTHDANVAKSCSSVISISDGKIVKVEEAENYNPEM